MTVDGSRITIKLNENTIGIDSDVISIDYFSISLKPLPFGFGQSFLH